MWLHFLLDLLENSLWINSLDFKEIKCKKLIKWSKQDKLSYLKKTEEIR
jgi:hypothetical protein